MKRDQIRAFVMAVLCICLLLTACDASLTTRDTENTEEKKLLHIWHGVEDYFPAWDTTLSAQAAQRHLNGCQRLLLPDANIENLSNFRMKHSQSNHEVGMQIVEMRKKFLLAMVLGLALLTLTACGQKVVGADSEVSEPIVLDLWHQWQGQGTKLEEFTNEAIATYETDHPDVTIQVHSLTGEVYKNTIAMEFAGMAQNIDVFYYHVPGYMERLADADRLLPLNDYLTEEVMEKLHEGTLSDTSVGNTIYGLPLYSSKYLLYCNQALFEQAGVDLPTTFDELLSAGEKLREMGVTPLAVGAQEPWLAQGLYESIVLPQVGADTIRNMLAGNVSICDIPGFRTAAQQMNQLFGTGVLGDAPLNLTEYDSMAKFFGGQAAMLFDGTWASRYIDASGMNLDDVAAIKFPTPNDSAYAGSYVGGVTAGSFFVNKNTDIPKEAADFCIYLTEYLGTRVYECGSGIACWDADDTHISPTLAKIVAIWDDDPIYMPCWDNLLPQKAADLHLRLCQELLTPDADINAFLDEHDKAIRTD